MRGVVVLALKDLRLLWRDRFGLFWILIFPLLFALFFGAIFSDSGAAGTMKIAVVDEEDSKSSRALVEKLRASPSLEIESMPLDAAAEAVRRGKKTAYVVVPKGYGLFNPDAPPLRVGLDPSRKAEAGFLEGLLMQASMESAFSDPEEMRRSIREQRKGAPPELDRFFDDLDRMMGSMPASTAASPARVVTESAGPARVTPRSSWEITFPSAILWAILGCAAGFAISMVQERTAGTLLRLRVAPVTRGQVLAGKGLACFLACIAVSLLLLGFGRLVFGLRILNPAVLGAAIVSTALCFVGVMMLLSVAGRTENSVSGAGWAVLLVFAMLGGGMVPLFVMPAWMQKLSHASPVKWGILSIEGGIWRGFTLAEVALPCGILLAVGAVCFAIGVAVFSRRET